MNSLSLVRDSAYVSGEAEVSPRRRASTSKGVPAEQLVYDSEGMRRAMHLVHRSAKTEVTITLIGETGVGKELVARAIHDLSPRNHRPFVVVNCPAIPNELAESLLFGHVRGAFTGAATDTTGFFGRANGGTLFLDELSDLSLHIQAKLLRAVELQRYCRIGATVESPIDVRIVVAVNKPLSELVRDGQFREDLFYRLNEFPINIPPLRERREDIEFLARHFWRQLGQSDDMLSAEVLRTLWAHDWPGNVRELKNMLRRVFILAEEPAEIPALVQAACFK